MSKHSVEIMESILQHLADEVEIDAFHHWISELCDPDSQLVQDANDKYFNKIKEEVELRNDANSMLGKKLTKHWFVFILFFNWYDIQQVGGYFF